MTKKRKKHKRTHHNQRKRAEWLVSLWYVDRCERREERYRAVYTRPVLLQAAISNKEYVPLPLWNRPLTASGKETRRPPSGNNPLKHPMDVDAAGEFEIKPELVFIRRAMLHVINVEPSSHKALEMNAAGYDINNIAEELGCGERLARDFLGDGLAVIRSCIILRNDLGW